MGIISEIYISSPARAVNYGESNGEGFERASFRGLTYEEFADLWRAIVPTSEDSYSDSFKCVLEEEDGELLIHEFPSEFVDVLASLDKTSAIKAAAAWVEIGEMKYLECDASEVLPIVEAARRLAVLSVERRECMYLWMCL